MVCLYLLITVQEVEVLRPSLHNKPSSLFFDFDQFHNVPVETKGSNNSLTIF